MKKYYNEVVILIVILCFILQACEFNEITPVSTNSFKVSQEDATSSRPFTIDSISLTPYIKHQLIVIYKKPPTPGVRLKIQNKLTKHGLTVVKQTACSSCDDNVELWQGPNIHTFIHAETKTSGSGGTTKGHGDDDNAFYSLNFASTLPHEPLLPNPKFYKPGPPPPSRKKKEKIIIAVLDTGVDTILVNKANLWKNTSSANCYPGDLRGWNFVGQNSNIKDTNRDQHGTLVSQYIINQFTKHAPNYVQIMSLKTHDANGYGKLFDIICAIHYAKNNGAKIINASWGFYYYETAVHSYLQYLLQDELRADSVLFFAASGNRIPQIDKIAVDSGLVAETDLRNLEKHHFYPAYLSDAANNIITVTTMRNSEVSPSQNYSYKHVDLGVQMDQQTTYLPTPDMPAPYNRKFEFLVPFPVDPVYLSGSSFATAIAAGRVGAYLPKGSYIGQEKAKVMKDLHNILGPNDRPITRKNVVLVTKAIRDGWYLPRGWIIKKN